MTSLECFFDCSSPWTWLAFENLQPIAAEFGVPIDWKPILVGGIFNTINPSVYESREHPIPAKERYMKKDLGDWGRHSGLDIRFPPDAFPVNSAKAMRACIVLAPSGQLVPFAHEAFKVYWSENRDISQDDVLRDICARTGADADMVLEAIARPAVKDALRGNTDEVIRRGGFGSPTIFVDRTDMYFGNDRLVLVRDALQRSRADLREAG
jgi:2-hydroxychromene-2-carboxylate isomerase